MIRATSAVLFAFLVTLTAMTLWVGYDVHLVLSGINARLNSATGLLARAQGLETKANATLVNLDKGTAVWAASAKDQAAAIQDLALDAHGTLSEANQTVHSIQPVAAALTEEVEALHKTTAQATLLAQALTGDAETAKTTIAAAQPVLVGLTRATDDLHILLKDEAIHQTLVNVQAVSGSSAAILADARRVADEETRKFLTPIPWWKQPIAKGGQLIDITAAIARHAP